MGSASDPRNVNIVGTINYQIIPTAELLRVTDLTTPYAATWAPLEAFRLLLEYCDETKVSLVFTRNEYM